MFLILFLNLIFQIQAASKNKTIVIKEGLALTYSTYLNEDTGAAWLRG